MGGGLIFKRNFNAALVGEYNRVILIVLSTEVIMYIGLCKELKS